MSQPPVIYKSGTGTASVVLASATDGVTIDAGGAGNTLREKPGGTGFASLAASALPKNGAVITSDYTQTSATFTNVTGATITTNGAAMIMCAVQVVAAAGVTGGAVRVSTSAGSISGVWWLAVDAATIGDLTGFGFSFGAPGATATSDNITTAATYDGLFIGWVSAAATVTIQAQSDGTRTFTVKVGSQISSNI